MSHILLVGIAFILVFGILVLVHEAGHYFAAKAVDIEVHEFGLGLGPKAVTLFRRGETDYTLHWIPLGGFVHLRGMEPDAEKHPRGFNSKPIWARVFVLLAGVTMNAILGLCIFLFAGPIVGIPSKGDNQVLQIFKGTPAEKMGLRVGDRILSVNGTPTTTGDSLVRTIHLQPNTPVRLEVARDGRRLFLEGRTTTRVITHPSTGAKMMQGVIGFFPAPYFEKVSLRESISRGWEMTGTFFQILGYIVSDGQRLKSSAGGPVEIVRQVSTAVKLPPGQIVNMTGQLSFSLAVFNLLPIPILDGGHLVLVLLEGIRRRRLDARTYQVVQALGLAVIAVLFVLIMFNDIQRQIVGNLPLP
jgi:regulator of sigma E protease